MAFSPSLRYASRCYLFFIVIALVWTELVNASASSLRVLRLVLICWCLLPYRFRSTLCIRVECEQSEMERLGVT